MSSHTIATATVADAADINRIQAETWLATYPNAELGITLEDITSLGLGSAERQQKWEKNLSNFDELSKGWVARDERGVSVGFCTVTKKDGRHLVRAMYVLPQAQHQGVGQQLLSVALEWLGIDKEIQLDVAAYNQPAIAFYEKNGFKKVEGVEPSIQVVFPSGRKLPEIVMRRDANSLNA